MKKAIVLGCHVGGLGVIRSLGLKGFDITALFFANTDFAQTSKYVHESFKIPHPLREEREFIDFLISNSYRWRGALAIDTGDEFMVPISKHKAELAKHYRIVTAEWEILRKFMDKKETCKLARKCGVPHPKTFLLNTLDELHEIKGEITYPCILKPVYGHEFTVIFKTKNFKVSNYNELLSQFKLCRESGLEVMIQEIIPEPDSDLYRCAVYVNSEGYIGAKFFRSKIRQNPPNFGQTRVAMSVDRIAEIEELTIRLLKEANFKGFAESDFKKDPRDNKFKLIEINARLTRPNWLATYCGVNFPWIMYMDLVEGKQVEVGDYKKGVYCIELYQDIRNLIFRRNKENFGLREYIKPYLSKNKTFADLSTDDFMPFLRQISILPVKFYRLFESFLYNNASPHYKN